MISSLVDTNNQIIFGKDSIKELIYNQTLDKNVTVEVGDNINDLFSFAYYCRGCKQLHIIYNNTSISKCKTIKSGLDQLEKTIIKSMSIDNVKMADTIQGINEILHKRKGKNTYIFLGYNSESTAYKIYIDNAYGPNKVMMGDLESIVVTNIDHKIDKCNGLTNITSSIIHLCKKVVNTEPDIKSLNTKMAYEICKGNYIINSQFSSNNKVDFRYQIDGAIQTLLTINKYNIAYLADSVGLGKTIVALRLISIGGYNPIVVCPNTVVIDQWKKAELEVLGSNKITYILNSYNQLQNKARDKNFNYDLVIFDEAHNFRNIDTLRYRYALEICLGKPVLLMGATPINNSINDIMAQLGLGLNLNIAYDFNVGILREYFDNINRQSNRLKNNTDEYKRYQAEIGNELRVKILSKLVIRRTRKDLENYYKDDIETGKIRFPKIHEPINITYNYPNTILASTIDILSGYNVKYNLKYAIYNKNMYIVKQNTYSQSQGDENLTENKLGLTGITKIRMIKLLDSSPHAFIKSLKNQLTKLELEISKLMPSDDDYIIVDLITNDELSIQYRLDLENDISVTKYILNIWEDKYSNIKSDKLLDILNNSHGKTVIFTEYIETANSIQNRLVECGLRVLKITGENSRDNNLEFTINSNFGIESYDYSNTYDILVCTNILSEGINLNRVENIINYDITWNPTVIEQRIGRLNRIDSCVSDIFIYNFFPCDEMDKAMSSQYNIISKYILIGSSIGLDINYLGITDYLSIVDNMDWIPDNNLGYAIQILAGYSVDNAVKCFENVTYISTISIEDIHLNQQDDTNDYNIFIVKQKGVYSAFKVLNNRIVYLNIQDVINIIKHNKVKIDNSDMSWVVEGLAIWNNINKDKAIGVYQSKLIQVIDRLMELLKNHMDILGIHSNSSFDTLAKLSYIKYNIEENIGETLAKYYWNCYTEKSKVCNNPMEMSNTLLNIVCERFSYASDSHQNNKWKLALAVKIKHRRKIE